MWLIFFNCLCFFFYINVWVLVLFGVFFFNFLLGWWLSFCLLYFDIGLNCFCIVVVKFGFELIDGVVVDFFVLGCEIFNGEGCNVFWVGMGGGLLGLLFFWSVLFMVDGGVVCLIDFWVGNSFKMFGFIGVSGVVGSVGFCVGSLK